MASAKKPAASANPLMKTYGERPVPFQFPGNQEKMYIGSEVCCFCFLQFDLQFREFRLAIIFVYFVARCTNAIHHYGVE